MLGLKLNYVSKRGPWEYANKSEYHIIFILD